MIRQSCKHFRLWALSLLVCAGAQAADITQNAILLPNGTEGGIFDRMGQAVAVDGSNAVVGAYLADDANFNNVGAVYVFRRTTASTWTRQQKVSSPFPAANDFFGNAVAISGSTMAVAAIQDDEASAVNCGAVYIFVNDGSAWQFQQRVVASDASINGAFGRSVALHDDTLVIGATRGPGESGRAYVFTRSGTNWTQQQQLAASDADANDHFGGSVAISGDRMVVGAERADNGASVDAGAAYAYKKTGTGIWILQNKLLPATFTSDDNFGISVGISGRTIVVGQPFLGVGIDSNKGAAIVFNEQGGVWVRDATLTAPDAQANDFFGRSVAISGNVLLAASYFDDTTRAGEPVVNSGSVYQYVKTGSTWGVGDKLLGSESKRNDLLGSAVAISGGISLAGSPYRESSAVGAEAGAGYVYTRDDATTTKLQVSNPNLTYGEPLELTATVSKSSYAIPNLTGSVRFYRDGTPLGTVAVDGNGSATLSLPTTGAGSLSVTAQYINDASFLSSESPVRTVDVAKATTSVALNVPAASSVQYGTNLNYIATLTVGGGLPLPSGNVQFVDSGSVVVGSAALVGGVAQLNINSLSVGSHSISAEYLGDSNYQGFSTSAFAINVTVAQPTLTVTTSPSTSLEGESATVVATLVGGLPAGKSVGFTMTSPTTVILGQTVTNASGVAVINTAPLALGTYQFSATFFGDGNHQGAADVSGVHTVLAAANLTISKSNGVDYVQSGSTTTYTIIATNTGPNAVTGATVIDDIDDDVNTGLFLPGAPWTCSASAGASCNGNNSGTGDLAVNVDIPVGGIITISVHATTRPDAEPFVSNSTSVVLPATMGDPDVANNTATDSDASGIFANGFEN